MAKYNIRPAFKPTGTFTLEVNETKCITVNMFSVVFLQAQHYRQVNIVLTPMPSIKLKLYLTLNNPVRHSNVHIIVL